MVEKLNDLVAPPRAHIFQGGAQISQNNNENTAMKIKQQALFWITMAVIMFTFVWAFRTILLPFVVGITIAYLLNPLVTKLSRRKLSRTLSTVLILFSFFATVLILLALLIPPLYQEMAQLIEKAPEYVDQAWSKLQPYVAMVEQTVNEEGLDESIQQVLKENIGGALSASSGLLDSVLEGGQALIELTTFVIVTPLVAFFMMIEWQSITAWIDGLLPRNSHKQIEKILFDIDAKISGFIRGQALVALSLGILYALALSIAGLQFGFLIGLASGALSIIPMFGSIVGLLISVGVAYVQTGELVFVATVAAIFLFGQFLEGNFITPKLMGQSVGLHPLWVLFALMAGGTLFGLVGMVLAVPVAASAGVILSFTIEQYKESKYYEA